MKKPRKVFVSFIPFDGNGFRLEPQGTNTKLFPHLFVGETHIDGVSPPAV
jgi:hypothetical protein